MIRLQLFSIGLVVPLPQGPLHQEVVKKKVVEGENTGMSSGCPKHLQVMNVVAHLIERQPVILSQLIQAHRLPQLLHLGRGPLSREGHDPDIGALGNLRKQIDAVVRYPRPDRGQG
jgi:hypothetical protein